MMQSGHSIDGGVPSFDSPVNGAKASNGAAKPVEDASEGSYASSEQTGGPASSGNCSTAADSREDNASKHSRNAVQSGADAGGIPPPEYYL
eukprot:scaffold271788_cov31-Prasinocladus_malaysianus.AAC.1